MQYKELAKLVKDEFDAKAGPTWHCICGTVFGSFVSYEAKKIINLRVGNMVSSSSLIVTSKRRTGKVYQLRVQNE